MKTVVVLVSAIAMLLTVPARTQSIRPDEAQDQVFGWMKIYDFKSATQPLTVDHRVYSTAQMTVAHTLANWIQQSYVPVGGLGDVIRSVSEKLTAYNQTTRSLPQSYGAYAKIYTDLKYGAARKVEPASNSHVIWSVSANAVYGVPAINLSTAEQYYFTLPTFAEQGYGDELEKAVDLSQHPVLGRYPSYFVRNSATGNRTYVLLSKDNRLPFVKLTKGEYLDALGAAITQHYNAEKVRITQAEQGNKDRIDRAMALVDPQRTKRLAALAVNRERYKDRLNEITEIATTEPDIALENYPDVFLRSGGSLRIPVYKVDPALAELCKTGGPQWIVVSWTAQLNDPTIKRLHDAVINNFNFEYVHNYFFAPEKVKGQPYAPLRNPAATQPIETVAASEASKARAADPDVHFFDDFSTTPLGKAPIGWKSTLNDAGASSGVSELDGAAGRWMQTSGFTLTPGHLKTPLPRDFAITYDLVASKDYTWGARGMTFKLSRAPAAGSAEAFISLRLRPGSGTAAGEAVLETQFPPAQGYLSGTKWFPVPGFSNGTQATATVTIAKQGERLQVFINTANIFESEKAIPAALLFNALSLNHGGTFNPNDGMFISNLTILKK